MDLNEQRIIFNLISFIENMCLEIFACAFGTFQTRKSDAACCSVTLVYCSAENKKEGIGVQGGTKRNVGLVNCNRELLYFV